MMENNRNKRFIAVGALVAVLSFTLLLIGVWLVLETQPNGKNIAAFVVLSLIFGGISAGLFYLKRKIGFILFAAGLAVGFFEMFRVFANGMGGWGDLVGIVSLFTWTVIGLACGGAGLFGQYLYEKIKNKKD